MYNVKKIWPNWSIVRLLGEGSFGKVYEIMRSQYSIEEHSALKVITIPQSTAEIQSLKSEGMDDKSVTSYYMSIVNDFVQEISLMSKLKGNPGIVTYEDFAVYDHEDGLGWDILIRMELLTPFADYLRDREFSDIDTINLGLDLCDSLAVCHKNNIIHRDIKIDNIFVSEDGKYKLGDFGVARTLEKTSGVMSKKGTYSYMAPEVYRGESYGPTADIYSLGMVLYRVMNYNREPFLPLPPETIKYSDKNQSLVKRMKGESLPAPSRACGELSEIILKCCEFSKDNRYGSAYELHDDLLALKKRLLERMSNPAHIDEEPAKISADESFSEHTVDGTDFTSDHTDTTVSVPQSDESGCYEATVAVPPPVHPAKASDKTINDRPLNEFSNEEDPELSIDPFRGDITVNKTVGIDSNQLIQVGLENKKPSVGRTGTANTRRTIGVILGWIGVFFEIVLAVGAFPYFVIQAIGVIVSMILYAVGKRKKVVWIIYLVFSILSIGILNIVSAILLKNDFE